MTPAGATSRPYARAGYNLEQEPRQATGRSGGNEAGDLSHACITCDFVKNRRNDVCHSGTLTALFAPTRPVFRARNADSWLIALRLMLCFALCL